VRLIKCSRLTRAETTTALCVTHEAPGRRRCSQHLSPPGQQCNACAADMSCYCCLQEFLGELMFGRGTAVPKLLAK
jgi:hypothetical protein